MKNQVVGNELLPIGVVARRAGLRVSALRYYESAGLIAPARRVGGRRVYDASVFSAIAVVKLAQDAGFTITETRMLISGFDRGVPASVRWQTMARRKIDDIARRIEQAERMKRLLERLSQCRCQTLDECVRSRSEALRTADLPDSRGT
jgi:MerR family transcriptional regulator, redox-sensitive transcriptional activator SoxR